MKVLSLGSMLLFAGASVWGTPAGQQEVPQTTNANLEVREAGGNLGATVEQLVAAAEGPMWIGYEVEEIPGRDGDCCGRNFGDGGERGGTFLLENERGNNETGWPGDREAKLESGQELMILVRAEKGRLEKVRISPAGCRLDAGGLRLVWLKDAKAEQSVAFLGGVVKNQEFSDQGNRGIGEQALTAIALHSDGAADQALEGFAAQGQPQHLRERAAFWMGRPGAMRDSKHCRRWCEPNQTAT